MVDYLKIQTNLLKWADKLHYNIKDRNKYLYFTDEKNVYILFEGHAIYRIPRVFWFLDIEKIFDGISPVKLENMLEEQPEITATKTADLVQCDKRVLNVFNINNIEPEKLYINTELLKPVACDQCTFYAAKNRKSPLFIYNNGELDAVVLPVNYAG